MMQNLGPGSLIKVVAGVIEKGGKVLIARRRNEGIFGGLWEFPGGKLEDDEDPVRGLERELAEELGVQTRVEDFLCLVSYRNPTLNMSLLAYMVAHVSGEFKPVDHDEVCWVAPAELDESVFGEPDREIVRRIIARAKSQRRGGKN